MHRQESDPAVISGLVNHHNQYDVNWHNRNPHPTSQGQIQVIFGPMFSGKTTELIRRCRRFQLANYRCVVIKYAKDNRYFCDDQIATHDSSTLAAIPAIDLTSLMPSLVKYEVIAIDEGQFFPDTVQVAEELANSGRVVIVAALDGDFKRQGFGNILNLVPRAESVVKLTAVCMICYKSASYTKRTSTDTALEVIGGSDKYIAVCRECHSEKHSKIENGHKNAKMDTNGKPYDDIKEEKQVQNDNIYKNGTTTTVLDLAKSTDWNSENCFKKMEFV